MQVKTDDPVNPGDLYGVTKCFDEALGHYVAEQEGLSVISIRIGAAQPQESLRLAENARLMDAFLSDGDLHQLLKRCIETPEVRYAVVHGLRDNRFKRLDLSDTRALTGYEPVGDAAALNELVPPELLDPPEHDAGSPEQRSGLRKDLPRPLTS